MQLHQPHGSDGKRALGLVSGELGSNSSLSLISYATLSNPLNLSETQYLSLPSWVSSSYYSSLWDLNDLMNVKHSAWPTVDPQYVLRGVGWKGDDLFAISQGLQVALKREWAAGL